MRFSRLLPAIHALVTNMMNSQIKLESFFSVGFPFENAAPRCARSHFGVFCHLITCCG